MTWESPFQCQTQHSANISEDRAFSQIESSKIKATYKKNILDVRELTFDRVVMIFNIVNELCPQGI